MSRPFPISPERAREIVANDDMDAEDYEKLFEYYCNNGEMPYGVAKARTGDPDQWIMNQLEQEFGPSVLN